MPTAMVTGPTSGIGRGFAELLARKGLDLVLVARDTERLVTVAEELTREYGIACDVLAADLSRREDVDLVATRLADRSRPVSVLVNCAGFGLYQSFQRTTVEDEQRLLDVLVTSVLRLTHAAVPVMVERGQGPVINVSSVAGFLPGGTYSAAKSWVTVFTEGLAQALRGTGVRAVAVCPGFVHTEFHQRAGMDMSSMPEWMWLEVPEVVDQAVRDLAMNRTVSVPGRQYKVFSAVLRHGPRSVVRRVAQARQGQVRTRSPR
jgi:short-subunit dehydrogenase